MTRLADYLGTTTARCRGCGGDYTTVLDLNNGGEHLCVNCTRERCSEYLQEDLTDITLTVEGSIAHLSDGRNVLFQDGEPLTCYTDAEAQEWAEMANAPEGKFHRMQRVKILVGNYAEKYGNVYAYLPSRPAPWHVQPSGWNGCGLGIAYKEAELEAATEE